MSALNKLDNILYIKTTDNCKDFIWKCPRNHPYELIDIMNHRWKSINKSMPIWNKSRKLALAHHHHHHDG